MKRYLTLLAIILAMQNANAGVFDGTQGAGTETDPYLIYNITDLKEVADSMGVFPNYRHRDLHFKLMADITTPIDFTIPRLGEDAVNSIYNHSSDGNGYKITLDFIVTGGVGQDVGRRALFRNLYNNAVVKNLSLDGHIQVIIGAFIASFVVYNYGIVQNCNNYASISGSTSLGGIVHSNYGIIQNCINYGNINGDHYIGGVAAYNGMTGLIIQCINAGNIRGYQSVGGIVHQLQGKLSYCINIGNIEARNIVSGGIVASYSTDVLNEQISVSNSINAGYVKGNSYVGGIVGSVSPISHCRVADCINTGVVEGTDRTGAILGFAGGSSYIFTNCHYDKQFCIHKGVNGQDVPGVSGHITRNMVGRKLANLLGDDDWTYVEGATLIESLYPQLKIFSESPDEKRTDASKVDATPIFLYDGIKDKE